MEVRGGSNNYYEKERVNMDYESALEYIHHCIDVGNIIFEIPKDEEIINAIKVALEKEIPKKPKFKTDYNIGVNYHVCPNCEAVVNEYHNYCSGFTPEGIDGCGQRLDWD